MSEIDKNNWHVLTVTRGGTVSLLRNMPLLLAHETAKRLDPWQSRVSGEIYLCNDGDIERIEVLGPEGWDGCKTAMQHSFLNVKITETESGPNKGRKYRSGSCSTCGYGLFEWFDELPRV